MKRKIIIFSSVLFTAALFIGAVLGLVFLFNRERGGEENEAVYEIAVADVIDVFVGEENKITPYLIGADGVINKSRFDYFSSSESVVVDNVDGKITVLGIPEEDVFVSISEKNTSVVKRVKLNIITKIEKVLGLIASDGSLVETDQKLVLGDSFAVDVITQPWGLSIKNYCKITVADIDGQEKNGVFNIAYSADYKERVNFEVTGIGGGTLNVEVLNAGGEAIYTRSLNFIIGMKDEALSHQILAQSGADLLSESELQAIERITINGEVSDLRELSYLNALDTVVLDGDTLTAYENLSDKYCYRVKESLFADCKSDENWSKVFDNVIPYDGGADEKYFVYRSKDGDLLGCEKAGEDYILQTYSKEGYLTAGWVGKDDKAIKAEDINDIAKNGLHIYAEWSPIEYTVTYHARGNGSAEENTCSETWVYDSEYRLKDAKDIGGNRLAGYKFVGWTDDVESDFDDIDAAAYEKGESVSNLANVNGGAVHLYGVWTFIEYKILFDVPDGAAVNGDPIAAKYGETYTLPGASYTGYTFGGWVKVESDGTEREITEAKNLTDTDGDEIYLTGKFTENTYVIYFDTNSGLPTDGDLGSSKTLKYTQTYTLPDLERTGFNAYSWFCDANENNEKDADEKAFNARDEISKVIPNGEVWLRVVWSAVSYDATFNYNGGIDANGKDSYSETYDYTTIYNFPTVHKTGYILIKWIREDTQTDYSPDARISALTDKNGEKIVFNAVWIMNYYVLTVTTGTGSYLTVRVNGEIKTDGSHDVAYNAPITVNYGSAVGYSNAKCTFTGGNMPASDLTVSTSAAVNYYVLTVATGAGSYLTVRVNGEIKTDGSYSVAYDSPITVNYGSIVGYNNAECTFTGGKMPAGNLTVRASAELNIYTLTVTTGVGSYLTVKVNGETKADGTYGVAYNTPITVNYGANSGYANAQCTFTGGNMPARDLTVSTSAVRNKYILTITTGIGSFLTVNVDGALRRDGTYSVAYNTPITVEYGANFGYNGARCTFTGGNMPAMNLTIASSAAANTHSITKNEKENSATITVMDSNGNTLPSLDKVPYGKIISVRVEYSNPNNQSSHMRYDGGNYYVNQQSYSFIMPNYDVELYAYSDGCFASGTMILMSDGTQKPIENIKRGDMIMSWNFITGELEATPVSLYWDHGEDVYNIVNLEFSDGGVVRIITMHGFFDYDLNEFVYISENNYTDYINHRFVRYDSSGNYKVVTLTNASVTSEKTGCYSLRSAYNDNAFAGGLLTLTIEDAKGFLTYFKVGDDLKYDEKMMQEDIDKYGLYTYEEWADYVSYEEFAALNGKYFKILIGKGIIASDDIFTLIAGLR
ncbi:MAG: InlB B-repeat-containing protein [Clostridiales bacterium]|jgi:hypothetical protein|nr:InlB B-repeat-containing protein [Clostridiales bacterium]